jgi:hemerythrin-like domain-containing protein
MEEALLFPAVEAATGMVDAGPTFVMRMEHEQMRGVLDQMAAAVASGDQQELLDQGDTLHILIQQHNVKEEGMLYPMAERALGGQWPELRAKLEQFELG